MTGAVAQGTAEVGPDGKAPQDKTSSTVSEGTDKEDKGWYMNVVLQSHDAQSTEKKVRRKSQTLNDPGIYWNRQVRSNAPLSALTEMGSALVLCCAGTLLSLPLESLKEKCVPQH